MLSIHQISLEHLDFVEDRLKQGLALFLLSFINSSVWVGGYVQAASTVPRSGDCTAV